MDLGLKDKNVLVLASSKGLGKATALQFMVEEAHVMISSRDQKGLQEAAKEIKEVTGREVSLTVADLSKAEDIKHLAAATADQLGSIDVLINNTGGPPAGTFEQFEDETWYSAFEINLLSFVRAIREVIPHMRRQGGGRIVNIASSSIKQPMHNLILSNTFRMGIMGLAKGLASELARDGILINTVGPGRIATDRLLELDETNAGKQGITVEQLRKGVNADIPLGRLGTPEEFAKIIVFLASDVNTYVTGQALLVDGGMIKAY